MRSQRRSGVSQRRACGKRFISWTPPLGFKSSDRSDVVTSSDLRVLDSTECIAGAHQSTQEEVSMISSSLIQGLLIAENAG